MNKFDFISLLATDHDMSKAEADRVMNTIIDAATDTLVKGEKVTLTGFCTIQTVDRASRVGRNPATGESIQIPAKRAVKFKVGAKLAEAVK